MDGEAADDAHSVSAVAVIDLSDGGRGDPHGLLSSHSVVVIGGEEPDALLGHTEEDDEEEEEEEEDDEEDDGPCGSDCGHDHASPAHMIHLPATHSPTPSSSGASASAGGGKRKRVVLSIHEKQQVLQRLEMGEQPVTISRDFGISRQQVSDIKKNKDRILAFCIDAKHLSSLRRKTLKATTEYHPGVEQELYRWLIRQRKLGRGVTPEALAHKTTDLFMQYAADDAANVSFRSINVWLRHFKRAHGIKTMAEDELARLPPKFTPAMDMSGAATNGDAAHASASGGGESSNNEGSNGRPSPTPSMLPDHHEAAAAVTAADDVSSYMSSMVLPQHQPQQYILQNHAPVADASVQQSFQMLMLSSAQLPAPPSAASTTANGTSVSPLQSCAQLAQNMTMQLSLFEREMASKLDTLDARVEKLCFSVLSTSASSHLHTTSSRFA